MFTPRPLPPEIEAAQRELEHHILVAGSGASGLAKRSQAWVRDYTRAGLERAVSSHSALREAVQGRGN